MFPRKPGANAIVFCRARLGDKTLEEGKRCAIRDNAGKGQGRIESDRLRVAMKPIALWSHGRGQPPSSILPVLN